jgi:hypothetical protein
MMNIFENANDENNLEQSEHVHFFSNIFFPMEEKLLTSHEKKLFPSKNNYKRNFTNVRDKLHPR